MFHIFTLISVKGSSTNDLRGLMILWRLDLSMYDVIIRVVEFKKIIFVHNNLLRLKYLMFFSFKYLLKCRVIFHLNVLSMKFLDSKFSEQNFKEWLDYNLFLSDYQYVWQRKTYTTLLNKLIVKFLLKYDFPFDANLLAANLNYFRRYQCF